MGGVLRRSLMRVGMAVGFLGFMMGVVRGGDIPQYRLAPGQVLQYHATWDSRAHTGVESHYDSRLRIVVTSASISPAGWNVVVFATERSWKQGAGAGAATAPASQPAVATQSSFGVAFVGAGGGVETAAGFTADRVPLMFVPLPTGSEGSDYTVAADHGSPLGIHAVPTESGGWRLEVNRMGAGLHGVSGYVPVDGGSGWCSGVPTQVRSTFVEEDKDATRGEGETVLESVGSDPLEEVGQLDRDVRVLKGAIEECRGYRGIWRGTRRRWRRRTSGAGGVCGGGKDRGDAGGSGGI